MFLRHTSPGSSMPRAVWWFRRPPVRTAGLTTMQEYRWATPTGQFWKKFGRSSAGSWQIILPGRLDGATPTN